MARNSFLSHEDLLQAEDLLMPPLFPPNGDVRLETHFSGIAFSQWLSLRLESALRENPHWAKAGPVALGSWARGQICPKSDFDLIFCGDEDAVKSLVDELHQMGLKIRYRVPKNPDNWQEGVEPFDILALLKAKPFTAEAAQKLIVQQKLIWKNIKELRKVLFKAILHERLERSLRYDSIANFLEPNLKYGTGALRDLEQALQVYELFIEKFGNSSHALNVLKYYRAFFLQIRQKLHLMGAGDTLTKNEQIEIAKWFGFKNHKDFMREVQRGLSRVSFYADWLVEQAKAGQKHIEKYQKMNFRKFKDPFVALKKDPSIMMQNRVRTDLRLALSRDFFVGKEKEVGETLDQIISVQTEEEYLVAIFRSRLIDRLLPEMQRLMGYSQHDQYHRFTADAHILQVLREIKRVYKKPQKLSALASYVKNLNANDWKILTWTALYHDLAKGLESHDHSGLGEKFVENDFRKYGFSQKFTDEIKWMVKNHLLVSEAAFKRNSRSPQTWQWLNDHFCVNERLIRLTIFTALDILGTNPEAWNDWKARLLGDLLATMQSKPTTKYLQIKGLLAKKKIKNIEDDFINQIDPLIFAEVPEKTWISEFQFLNEHPNDDMAVYKAKKSDYLIRFYSKKDRPGLFAGFVKRLYQAGCQIRHASIQTDDNVGVYDWFQVSTTKNSTVLKKLIQIEPKNIESKKIKFEAIDLVSQDEHEWVFSFKGLDQEGLLLSAAESLLSVGATIRWAKVHTWGRQIEDIFSIKPLKQEATHALQSLREIST